MIVFEDWAFDLMEITDSLEIKVKGSSPLELSDIQNSAKKNREMNGENQYGDNWGCFLIATVGSESAEPLPE